MLETLDAHAESLSAKINSYTAEDTEMLLREATRLLAEARRLRETHGRFFEAIRRAMMLLAGAPPSLLPDLVVEPFSISNGRCWLTPTQLTIIKHLP